MASRDYAISIDLGGTFIKGALVDGKGHILERREVPTGAGTGCENILANIRTLVGGLADAAPDREAIVGIGVGVPGSIDTKAGQIRAGIANVPELNGLYLVDELAKHFPFPAWLDNDATNAARGEFQWGAGRGLSNLMCITLGTGIGAGLVLGGKVYQGISDYAGEFGHMIAVPDGKPCSCGNFGCIEAYASGTAMVNAARHQRTNGRTSVFAEYGDEEITPRLVDELAEKGEIHAREIMHEAGQYLGTVLASVVNLLNLELVVVGGGVARAGRAFFDPLEVHFGQYVLPEAGRHCRIVKAELGNDAGVLGGAALAFQEHAAG